MAQGLVHRESPMEFFREQLETAMEHQKVSTSAFTQFYLANLLASAVDARRVPTSEVGFEQTPLALLYIRALEASRHERARLLRLLGDAALFVSGFFADSLGRRLIDLDYCRTIGGGAYARLSRETTASGFGPELFSELAARFTEFSDVLQEVSEASRLAQPQSVVALYERWLQTGSRRAARLLADRGVVPVASSEGPVQ
jgi:hypothetical protein